MSLYYHIFRFKYRLNFIFRAFSVFFPVYIKVFFYAYYSIVSTNNTLFFILRHFS